MWACTASWLRINESHAQGSVSDVWQERDFCMVACETPHDPKTESNCVKEFSSTARSNENPCQCGGSCKARTGSTRATLVGSFPPRQAAWAAARVSADHAVPARAQVRQPQYLPAPAGAAAEGLRTLQTLAAKAPPQIAGTAGETKGWGF